MLNGGSLPGDWNAHSVLSGAFAAVGLESEINSSASTAAAQQNK